MSKYMRQRDLVDNKIFNEQIHIIGVGGIGSFTALTLAKMGFMFINVYDMDTVEEHNLPNQFYRAKDIGRNKADALVNLIKDFERQAIVGAYPIQWTANTILNGIVIMAVDTMQTREEIYHAIKKNKNVIGFIDGRMGGQQAEVYTVKRSKKDDIAFYESWLLIDSEIEPLRCTEKAIIYNVVFIASLIANQLRLLLSGMIYKQGLVMDFDNSELINVPKGVKNAMSKV